MKVLVTGTTGFIGRHVMKRYSSLIQFVGINRYATGSFNQNEIFIPSISENTDWKGKLDDVDSIIHLAGIAHNKSISESDVLSVNVKGTLRLAEAAAKAGVRRFVFVSSVSVNDLLKSQTKSSDVLPNEISFLFSNSKLQTEIGLKKISVDTGLEVTIVRSTLVYGFNAPGNFGLLTKLVKISPFQPFGLINNKRDFIAVQNLADLLITCTTHADAAGKTFVASDGKSISTKELTNAIGKGLNKKVIQLPVPVDLMLLIAKVLGKTNMAKQLFRNLEYDSSDLQNVLGWAPPYTMEQAMYSLRGNENDKIY